MLQKMGWSQGKGLGKEEDGMATHVRVKKRSDNMGACAEGCVPMATRAHVSLHRRVTAHGTILPSPPPPPLHHPRAAIGAERALSGNGVHSSAVSDYNRLLAELGSTAAVGACRRMQRA
jgi:hypothetical protein